MIIVTMRTEDEKMSELARAYWSQTPEGTWEFKSKELASRFSVSIYKLHSIVASVSNATHADLTCDGCEKDRKFSSRTFFSELLQEKFISVRLKRNAFLCLECRNFEDTNQQAEEECQLRVTDQKIIDWIDENLMRLYPKSYENSPLLDAFLIDGLLRYAGDAWKGEQLDSWKSYEPHLCETKEGTIEIYQHLYSNGWIVPHANSPTEAFTVDSESNVQFDYLRVNWQLAPNEHERPFNQITTITETLLSKAKSEDLLELWQWTCLHELRAHFNYWHDRYDFGSRGWTEKIEEQLLGVLQDWSLAQAKSIVYFSIKDLTVLLQDRNYVRPHVHNMLAGKFSTLANRYRANGWNLTVQNRQSTRTEAIHTSHLFDHVLGGGDELYYKLTGNQLRNIGTVGSVSV